MIALKVTLNSGRISRKWFLQDVKDDGALNSALQLFYLSKLRYEEVQTRMSATVAHSTGTKLQYDLEATQDPSAESHQLSFFISIYFNFDSLYNQRQSLSTWTLLPVFEEKQWPWILLILSMIFIVHNSNPVVPLFSLIYLVYVVLSLIFKSNMYVSGT